VTGMLAIWTIIYYFEHFGGSGVLRDYVLNLSKYGLCDILSDFFFRKKHLVTLTEDIKSVEI
jgi:hypothetical protein